MNGQEVETPGFAPSDPSDGRKPGDWQTRYTDPKAKRAICFEATYLGFLLVFTLVALSLMLLERPQEWLGLQGNEIQRFNLFVGAWVSGTLGGTLYAIKWLYHMVASNWWNIDRRLWRLFTPHISGTLAILLVIMISSSLFGFFDPGSVDRLNFVIAFGFLTGYFSDAALAKLSDIAMTVFGKSEEHGKKK
jgi:hypothetical protein